MSLPPGVDLSQIPSLRPPPGVIPNFKHPPSLADALIAVDVVFLALMLVAVGVRVYTKGFILRSLGWDDYTCVLAAFGSIAHTGLVIEQTQHGYGTHQWDVPLSVLTSSDVHVLLSETVIYYPVIFCVKLSILLLYLRIFAISRGMKFLIYGAMAIQVVFYLAFTAVAIALEFLCTAESAATRPFCVQNYKVTILQSGFGVATDFYVLLLPVAKVWQLQLPFRRKVGVIAIFMTGFLACIASLVRAIFVIQRIHSLDSTYVAGSVSIYTAVEINAGIISGAMTASPMFFRKHHFKPFGLSTFGSLKTRLFGKSKGSASRRTSGPSKTSDPFHRVSVHVHDNSYTELNDVPSSASLKEQKREGNTPGVGNESMDRGSESAGIVRTDDYDGFYPGNDHAKQYMGV